MRGARGELPVTVTAEVGTNSLIVAAKKSEHAEIEELVKKLDIDPTANEEIVVVALEHLDAPEALEILESYLQRPGPRRGRGGDLAGGTRLVASDSMNAVVISGKKENVLQAEKVLRGLDVPSAAADRVPKMIQLENAQPSLMAMTLSQIFTEPAQQMARRRRGSAAQQMVPLILSDESTKTLIVRARKSDFNLIEQMAKQLDREDFGGVVKIIPVPQTMDVVELAEQVERAVNEGERNLAARSGRRASQIAVISDERTSSLIVSGPSELFGQAEQIVKQLQEIRPPGAPAMRIIQLKNIDAQEISQVLDQMMERQSNTRSGRRRYRRRY
jgi:type II secretory pathway component GspD/PulD (secretin)